MGDYPRWSSWWRRWGNHAGENPGEKGRVLHAFYQCLLSTYSVLSPSLCPGLFPVQAGRVGFWVCFHKPSSSFLCYRPGPGCPLGPAGICLLCHGWQLQPALQWARRSWHECYVPFGTGSSVHSPERLIDSLCLKQPGRPGWAPPLRLSSAAASPANPRQN